MMFEKDVHNLHKLVEQFKQLQEQFYPEITEENDNGEWEIGLELWEQMNQAYLVVVKKYGVEISTDSLLDDMLYVIARDNESSYLLQETRKYPQWFELLGRSCVKTNYTNAKWQFAEQIGHYKESSNLSALLFYFIDSGDEYTERMALQSLCEHFPERVEEFAKKMWERNVYAEDEYQKIMVLYALHRIKSPLLEGYLAEAAKMDYPYLKEWADKISYEI